MNAWRILKHLFAPHWLINRAFPRSVLAAIGEAIAESEKCHDGELRFVVEAGLQLQPLWRGQSSRQRAEELFASLRVWDTAHNSGVLIYVQMIDRRIEIVADRGIAARVPQAEWDAICRRMEVAFRERQFEPGARLAILAVTTLLARHFPPKGDNPNELPDSPLVL
jgi:hypothetical protein